MEDPPKPPETTVDSELSLSPQEVNTYKEIFDKEALAKKKQYLAALQQHNKTLISKIKDFDKKVNSQIDSLSKKIVNKKKNFVPQFDQLETRPLKEKFQQYHALKMELQAKRTGVNSLQFLLNVKRKYEKKLQQINNQTLAMKKQIHHLNKIKQKSLRAASSQSRQVGSVGDLDVFGNEIEQLRERVRGKNESLQMRREQFIKVYKQSKSTNNIPVQQPPKDKQEVDPELAQLKQEYEQLGKKVDALRLKKAALVDQLKAYAQQKKSIQRLKSKRASVVKVPRKGIGQIMNEMNEAIAEIDKLNSQAEERALLKQ